MELTKEQIQYIDDLLKKEGIKYWDIRIEMIDHVVLDVEKRMDFGVKFDEAIQSSFESLGWRENFNGGGFEAVFQRKLNIFSKKIGKRFRKEFSSHLKSVKFYVGLLIFLAFQYSFYQNSMIMKAIVFFIFGVYVCFMLFFAFKYKIFKSARLNSALIISTLPLSISNALIFLHKVFFGEEDFRGTYVFLIWTVITPFLFIGIKFLYKEFKSMEQIHKKMIN